MDKERDINITLGLSQDDPNTKITLIRQSMARYPKHLENITQEFLQSGTPEAMRSLDLLANFRAELNFWCRDNCKGIYKIEECFESQGMRVYFAVPQDQLEFEKHKDTVTPPETPDFISSQYQS